MRGFFFFEQVTSLHHFTRDCKNVQPGTAGDILASTSRNFSDGYCYAAKKQNVVDRRLYYVTPFVLPEYVFGDFCDLLPRLVNFIIEQ